MHYSWRKKNETNIREKCRWDWTRNIFHTWIYSDLRWVWIRNQSLLPSFDRPIIFISQSTVVTWILSMFCESFTFVLCWKRNESGVHLKVSTEIPSYIFTIYDNKIIPWWKFGLVTPYIKSCFIHGLFSYTYIKCMLHTT